MEAGDIEAVNLLLGRMYAVKGEVIRDGRGRQIGFPTANIGSVTTDPGKGVAAWARCPHGELRPAAVNIGVLPTIAANRHLSVEAHILDFAEDCYAQALQLYFVQHLRSEQRFESLDALVEQIGHDVAKVRSWSEQAEPPSI